MSKEKAYLSMSVSDINLIEAPQYIHGTNFYFIGTVKPDAAIIWGDTTGEGSSFEAPTGCKVFVRSKDVQDAFTRRMTVEDAVRVMRNHPPGDDDCAFFNVTLDTSLPELFMRNQRAS